jgi:hypothetical protein
MRWPRDWLAASQEPANDDGVLSRVIVGHMTEIWDGKTIEELTTLVRQELDELGGSAVRFIIRPLPYGGPNWYIETDRPFRKLRRDEQAAVSAASFDLRSKYYLRAGDGPS